MSPVLANTCEQFPYKSYPDITPYLEPHEEFTGSYTQMYSYQAKTMVSLNKRYDLLCKRIVENFKEDKLFVEAFKNDIEAFKVYIETQNAVALPRNPQEYGFMYYNMKWENDYRLTVLQIENTYKNIVAYCDFNSAFLKDSSVCSQERISKMFKGLKLK